MTILRIVFFLLVALNLACAAAIAMPFLGMPPLFLGASEPERLASQVFPEKLRVLSTSTDPSAPIADASAGGASAPVESPPVAESTPAAIADTSAPVAAAPAPVTANAVTSAPGSAASSVADNGAAVCVAFKNLSGTQAQALAQRARGNGTSLTVREEAAAPSSFWVNIPPQGGKAGADRRAAELKQLGLDDFFIVNDAGDNRYAISLGLFRAESLAQRQLETLQKKGVKGATVTARENANGARVELIGAGAQIEKLVRDASGDIAGVVRDTCKPG